MHPAEAMQMYCRSRPAKQRILSTPVNTAKETVASFPRQGCGVPSCVQQAPSFALQLPRRDVKPFSWKRPGLVSDQDPYS